MYDFYVARFLCGKVLFIESSYNIIHLNIEEKEPKELVEYLTSGYADAKEWEKPDPRTDHC